MSPNRAIAADKSNFSSPLAVAQPWTILSWPEALNASGETPAEQRPFRFQQLPVDPGRTLALQVPDRHRHAVPGGHAQQHVDVVRHCLTLHQLDILLTAQIPQDLPDLTPKPSVEDLTAVLRYNHDVVLAIPPLHGTGSAIRA